MSQQVRIISTAFGFGAVLFCLVGCGEKTGEITGTVTYKGAPVTPGSISFHMNSKGIAQDAKLDSAGKFTMAAPLPTGTYQLFYVPPIPEPQDPSKPRADAPKAPVVPQKCLDLQTSGLSVEVKAGKNDFPIELKD